MHENPLRDDESLSRRYPREEDVRGPFFRDQTAILHCTPFRRLKKKTQVFFAPENDHICTRMEHVLHVASIAVTIARGLSREGWAMDADLAYAAGMGHDLGHTPFGHSGERALALWLPGGFRHEENSLRVADILTREGRGLNLTRGVRDAILCHNGESHERTIAPEESPRLPEDKLGPAAVPATWEGCTVRMADKIAYLGRDMEDAITAGILTPAELPLRLAPYAENLNSYLIDLFVEDLLRQSPKEGCLAFSEGKYELFEEWLGFNTEKIYHHTALAEYEKHTMRILKVLLEEFGVRAENYLLDADAALRDQTDRSHPAFADFADFYLPLLSLYGKQDARRLCADYVAGMTDQFALEQFRLLLWPRPIA